MTAAVTIHLNEETLSALDALSARLDQPRSALVNQALEDWLTLQKWQMDQIAAGIADADAGNFATDEEVSAVFAKYGVRYGENR